MNVAVIGKLEQVAAIIDKIEEATLKKCHHMELSDNLNEILKKNYWHLIIIAADHTFKEVACELMFRLKKTYPAARVMLLSTDQTQILNVVRHDNEAGKGNRLHGLTEVFSNDELIGKLIKEVEHMREVPKTKKVLAIGAHPNDVEVGCGATLHKHKAEGDEVSILILGGDDTIGNTSLSYKEAMLSADYLGADLFMKNLPILSGSAGDEVVKSIESTIEVTMPDIIYTHTFNDSHKDHRNTHYATLVAAKNVEQIYAYLSPTGNLTFHPEKFEHVEAFMNNKITMAAFYKSKADKQQYLSDTLIHSTAQYWGRFSRYGLVEPFEVVRG
ncbi:PIG-L deacetylase family protein [Chitinophagaceae bacterium LWZ2-11]